jgi:hypothetical protein
MIRLRLLSTNLTLRSLREALSGHVPIKGKVPMQSCLTRLGLGCAVLLIAVLLCAMLALRGVGIL